MSELNLSNIPQNQIDFVSMQKSKYIKNDQDQSMNFDLISAKNQSISHFSEKKKINANFTKNEKELYSQIVCVKLKQNEREDRTSMIQIQIFNNNKNNRDQLHFRLTDENDLQFLKTLDLSESDFY